MDLGGPHEAQQEFGCTRLSAASPGLGRVMPLATGLLKCDGCRQWCSLGRIHLSGCGRLDGELLRLAQRRQPFRRAKDLLATSTLGLVLVRRIRGDGGDGGDGAYATHTRHRTHSRPHLNSAEREHFGQASKSASSCARSGVFAGEFDACAGDGCSIVGTARQATHMSVDGAAAVRCPHAAGHLAGGFIIAAMQHSHLAALMLAQAQRLNRTKSWNWTSTTRSPS